MTRCPMPLSPFTSTLAADSRSMRISGCTFTAPPLMRRMYCGSRNTPWPSEPFTSARVMSSAMVLASDGGTSTASKARAMKASSFEASSRKTSLIVTLCKRSHSIDPDVVVLDDASPTLRFGMNEGIELLRCRTQADRQLPFGERALRVELFHCTDRLRVQLAYDCPR